MSGEDPDYSKRELWEKMERAEEVEWTASVQIMQPEEADANLLGFDPFDVTKVWPRAQFPVSLRRLSNRRWSFTDANRCTSSVA